MESVTLLNLPILFFTLPAICAWLGAVEISVLMILVCLSLTYTQTAARSANQAGRRIVEWDYLICSYYHEYRPISGVFSQYWSFFSGMIRLVGGGPIAERKLFNRLTRPAIVLGMMTTLVEIVSSVLRGESISVLSLLTDAATDSLSHFCFFSAPLLAGQVARLKLLRENGGLLLIGNCFADRGRHFGRPVLQYRWRTGRSMRVARFDASSGYPQLRGRVA